MHVLMLGWEFPPYITGGLGTACFGLTRAMDRRGLQVTFVVPRAIEHAADSHVRLVAPAGTEQDAIDILAQLTTRNASVSRHAPQSARAEDAGAGGTHTAHQFDNVRFLDIPAALPNPYNASQKLRRQEQVPPDSPIGENVEPASEAAAVVDHSIPTREEIDQAVGNPPRAAQQGSTHHASLSGDYGGDIIAQVERYAHFVLSATRHLKFDIIHAHDWMTYPAGMLLARATGRPLVVHIHSTEFDRSGEHVNQRIYDIERRGMHSAMRVIAVSQLTKNMVVSRYAVPDSRVEVVYNGVDLEPTAVGMTGIRSKDKIVLYFGRITHQKGPEYFIRAAKRVLEVMDNVKFVVAGSGDMAKRMIELAAEMGIGHKVLFTGFLRGNDIKRVFNLADLYVMPSVSEPFGIAPLEAMSHNVPALISKSSGVSEVLTHALKVDFWDVDDMANKIVAVLRYPPLSATLREHGTFEVRRLTWDGAADRCNQVYQAVLREMVAAHTIS